MEIVGYEVDEAGSPTRFGLWVVHHNVIPSNKENLDEMTRRKLTEVEYERLQGLPDGYTDVNINGRKLSYSKRCSLMGNGWNEPTVEWILSGLKENI